MGLMEFEKKHSGFFSWKHYFSSAIGFSICYTLSGFFCILQLSVPPDHYSLMWLPSGIGLVMFLVLGNSAFLWVLISSFVINTYFYISKHYDHLEAFRLFLGALNALIDVLQAFIAWKIVLAFEKSQKHPLFSKNSQLISFFFFVCLIPSIITSGILIIVKTFERSNEIDFATFLRLSIYLTVGNTIGILLVAPLFWAIKVKQSFKKEIKQFPFTIAIVVIAILLLSFYKFSSIVFLIIPLLVFLARKGNLLHSIIVSFIICILLSVGTAYGKGFFGIHFDSETSFETVLFLLPMMFVLYIATIAFAELKLHQEKLQTLVDESVSTLEISEQRYRMLAENVADVIWVMNLTQGKFTFISPSVFQLRGVTVEEAMQESLVSSLGPESAKSVIEKLAVSIKSLEDHPNEKKYSYDEIQQYRKDGSLIWIETVTHLVINSNGEMEVMGVSRDINERKKAEVILTESKNKLNDLNATKDKFFSIIAHDLMSPFNTLIGFCSLLLRQAEKNDMNAVTLSAKLMQDSAEKTRSLLKNLLEWSRTQTGNIAYIPEMIELASILEEETDLLLSSAQQKGIELQMNIPIKTMVFADKYMLRTIFRNIISNAIKYTYPGGLIKVSVENKQSDWLFKIMDNGVGMEPAVCETIFIIGAHKSEAGTQKEQGTGLGLILCKEFVVRNGGKIWVESKLGEGSAFYFTLPATTV
jgi:PAS domain S-box-containing protein